MTSSYVPTAIPLVRKGHHPNNAEELESLMNVQENVNSGENLPMGFTSGRQFAVLGVYISLWYSLTILYNIANKRVLSLLPVPATIATIQLFIGIPLFLLPLWWKGQLDSFQLQNIKPFWKIALAHGLGHVATSYSISASSVAFTHVVKAAEPVFSAILSAVLLHSYLPTPSYFCLIPIVVGVAWASLSEASFTWFGLFTAMLSNLFYQLRNVLSKYEFGRGNSHSETSTQSAPSPVELFRIITILAAFQTSILAAVLESSTVPSALKELYMSTAEVSSFVINLIVSGVSYYLYNEVAFRILDLLSPTSHSVANALKRIVIIAAASILLGTPMTAEGSFASTVAVAGTLLYSLSQSRGQSGQRSVQFG